MDVDGAWLLFLLLPVIFLVVAAGMFFLVIRLMGLRAFEMVEVEQDGEQPVEGELPGAGRWHDHEVVSRDRPWWGNPLVWIGVAVGFLVLGLVVAPHFLGGTFLFIPFFWVARPRTVARRGPR